MESYWTKELGAEKICLVALHAHYAHYPHIVNFVYYLLINIQHIYMTGHRLNLLFLL